MKTCKDCGAVEPLATFYARHGECKECTKIKVRAYQAANAERVRTWNTEQSRERQRARDRSPERRRYFRERKVCPIKRAARAAVQTAIKAGRLVRSPCEVCGAIPADAHHDDYSRPIDVRWLCKPHHDAHHAAERAANIQRAALANHNSPSRWASAALRRQPGAAADRDSPVA